MNKDIKVTFEFEIKQGDEIFTHYDYVEVIPKDNKSDKIYRGYISGRSNGMWILIVNDEESYCFYYSEIAEIKSIK